ncbi:histidine kinase dimerization/phospho-acceptor domain-containing protein [Leptolyngbya sp. FACHB-261]|uniref:histidine kinase dimerization/phospho-acceptor domain-containing protein n=1 Tax=Leptolyngbya sp. FACHB-261 TaxID=2692806 RepID=UPI0028C402CA|nr:histidine kinase dimerization/phospho-acceptor domain-containing protein [Leptolyngbya sp. FACHB-261]
MALRTAELHAAQDKLVEQERLAAIGEFVAAIVHELRNPLTTVLMGLSASKKLVLSPPFQERLSLAFSKAFKCWAKLPLASITRIAVNRASKSCPKVSAEILQPIVFLCLQRVRILDFEKTYQAILNREDVLNYCLYEKIARRIADNLTNSENTTTIVVTLKFQLKNLAA